VKGKERHNWERRTRNKSAKKLTKKTKNGPEHPHKGEGKQVEKNTTGAWSGKRRKKNDANPANFIGHHGICKVLKGSKKGV